jgi:Tol biopolymer transport system component
MASHRLIKALLLVCALLLEGCQNNVLQPPANISIGLRATPAVRLNFRYDADVPPPTIESANSGDRNAAVQSDFDANRTQELLDKTIISPDKQRVAAIYHRLTDVPSEYRLDMYTGEGKLLRKVSSETMAVHFPDTIVWSPDSSTLAFVAMVRVLQPASPQSGNAVFGASPTPAGGVGATPINDNAQVPTAAEPSLGNPTPAAPTGILTLRTEQIYICGSEGADTKPLTLNEGLIYFYYAWSPDSTMLTALSATSREWRYLEVIAGSKGEVMMPQGRPRVIEKNGRERRLDDNLTSVRPVWSPDSSKVAAAFNNQIRIYDAAGTTPTQAAIPLRNQLLISSQAYDRQQQKTLQSANEGANTNSAPGVDPSSDQAISTLPDEKLLVSYNPVVALAWTSDDLLYFETAYLKQMKNELESVRSFSRWHRLVLTAQAPVANK